MLELFFCLIVFVVCWTLLVATLFRSTLHFTQTHTHAVEKREPSATSLTCGPSHSSAPAGPPSFSHRFWRHFAYLKHHGGGVLPQRSLTLLPHHRTLERATSSSGDTPCLGFSNFSLPCQSYVLILAEIKVFAEMPNRNRRAFHCFLLFYQSCRLLSDRIV